MPRFDYRNTVMGLAIAAAIAAFASSPAAVDAAAQELPGGPRDFITQMTIANLADVQLGNLAVERATSEDVKAFGRMMVKDHSMANSDLAAIATQLRVQPPTDLDRKRQELVERFVNVQSRDFDREYVAAVIESQRELERQLKARLGDERTLANPSGGAYRPDSPPGAGTPGAVGTSGKDPDNLPLDRWASRTLPAVRQHLEQAQQLQQNIR